MVPQFIFLVSNKVSEFLKYVFIFIELKQTQKFPDNSATLIHLYFNTLMILFSASISSY